MKRSSRPPSNRRFTVTIDDKKSSMSIVRGIVSVDAIDVPFSAHIRYRPYDASSRSDMQPTMKKEDPSIRNIVVKSKSGILETYSEKNFIKKSIKYSAKCWWIDILDEFRYKLG